MRQNGQDQQDALDRVELPENGADETDGRRDENLSMEISFCFVGKNMKQGEWGKDFEKVWNGVFSIKVSLQFDQLLFGQFARPWPEFGPEVKLSLLGGAEQKSETCLAKKSDYNN